MILPRAFGWIAVILLGCPAGVVCADGHSIRLRSGEAWNRRNFTTQEGARAATGTKSGTKKLIEFGWDEPDTSFLRRHHGQLSLSPFDGCVFHVMTQNPRGATENFTWLAWGRRRFTPAETRRALDDLRSLAGPKFRQHFLRFNVTPADLDWFDDHGAILENAAPGCRAVARGGCAGILLDTEQYEGKLFDPRPKPERSRHSWEEYATQVRKRGREVMNAFQEGFPDLTVLVTFGHSLLWKESDGGKKPLSDCKYGLLVPFLDGMVEAVRGKTKLVDGHEMSYGYRDPRDFITAHEVIALKSAALCAIRRGIATWFRRGLGSGSITTGESKGGKPTCSIRTIFRPRSWRRASGRPSNRATSMSGFIPRSRAGGQNGALLLTCPGLTSKP